MQRSLALQLSLNAVQARLVQLQSQCDEQAARWQVLASDAAPTATDATRPADGGAGVGAASGEVVRVQAAAMAQAQSSPRGRGLLAQVRGTTLGVTTGLVTGGLLLQALQGLLGPDVPSPGLGAAASLPTAALDEGDGLCDLGEDWA